MSKGARKFVNPLTQPSTPTSTETQSLPATETFPEPATVPTTLADTNTFTEPSSLPVTSSDTEPSTYTSTLEPRKRGKQAFERTHKRVTLWIDKGLEKRFEALSKRDEVAKSTLLDEAVRDLLAKHKA